MRVLVVSAHPNPRSFCHALRSRFLEGLRDAGHDSDVIDLYAEGFDPVFRMKDYAFFAREDLPAEVIATMNPRQRVESMAGGRIRRWLAKRMIRDKSDAEVLGLIARHRPADVLAHQKKLARAGGLAILAPVFWMSFPAILKGWIDRAFSYGFAYSLTEEGWRGDVDGRVPLLKHEKALVMMTTFFTEDHYRKGFEEAMQLAIDDWTFRYPGVRKVEHEYFYAVRSVDESRRKAYLDRAYELGMSY